MSRAHVIAAVIAFTPIAASASNETWPTSWPEFEASKNTEDIKNIAWIRKADIFELCRSVGKGSQQKMPTRRYMAIREYLMSTKAINQTDLVNIPVREVAIGMTLCGVIASLGKPARNHERESEYSRTLQLVYDRGTSNRYVHLTWRNNDFVVTSTYR